MVHMPPTLAAIYLFICLGDYAPGTLQGSRNTTVNKTAMVIVLSGRLNSKQLKQYEPHGCWRSTGSMRNTEEEHLTDTGGSGKTSKRK